MSKLLASIGLGLMLASTAAVADSNSTPNDKPSNTRSRQTYCIRLEPDTGSHYVRTECRTKEEWMRLGVDVDELTKK